MLSAVVGRRHLRFKASKTLLGIETNQFLTVLAIRNGFKASKTLLGIETIKRPNKFLICQQIQSL